MWIRATSQRRDLNPDLLCLIQAPGHPRFGSEWGGSDIVYSLFDVFGFKAGFDCKGFTPMDIRRIGNSDIQLKNARLSPPNGGSSELNSNPIAVRFAAGLEFPDGPSASSMLESPTASPPRLGSMTR
jgi:hypothetical protein